MMRTTSFTRRAVRTAAIAAALAGGGLAVAAGPAFAAGSPTGGANATITVSEQVTFAFTSSPAFTLAPNTLDADAINFQISTNDGSGFALDLSAPDPVNGGGNSVFGASTLSYQSYQQGGAGMDSGPQSLSNTPAQAFRTTQATNGTNYYQGWTANLPANTPPGSYTTTVTYTAIGN